jgi:hypothetical protein
MKPFTKNEFVGITLILICVGFFFAQGILMSLLRARDSQRMGDLNTISNAVTSFHEEYGFFPESENGQIKACKGDTYEESLATLQTLPRFDRGIFSSGLKICVWGEDQIVTMTGNGVTLPRDPQTNEGLSYTYLSNDNRFQILGHLESNDDFYDASVEKRNIACGKMTCNVGKAYGETPLDRSIEQFEQELLKNKNK